LKITFASNCDSSIYFLVSIYLWVYIYCYVFKFVDSFKWLVFYYYCFLWMLRHNHKFGFVFIDWDYSLCLIIIVYAVNSLCSCPIFKPYGPPFNTFLMTDYIQFKIKPENASPCLTLVNYDVTKFKLILHLDIVYILSSS